MLFITNVRYAKKEKNFSFWIFRSGTNLNIVKIVLKFLLLRKVVYYILIINVYLLKCKLYVDIIFRSYLKIHSN